MVIIRHIIAPIAIGIAGDGIHGTMVIGGILPTIHGHGAGTPIGIRIGDPVGARVGTPDRIILTTITITLRCRPEHIVRRIMEGIWLIIIPPAVIVAEEAVRKIVPTADIEGVRQADVHRL